MKAGKKLRFTFPHKKGASKVGDPRYTKKIRLNDFHNLKRKFQEEIRPLHKDHWGLVGRVKYEEKYEHCPKILASARTAGLWRPFKFAVRLDVVTQHYLTVEYDYTDVDNN